MITDRQTYRQRDRQHRITSSAVGGSSLPNISHYILNYSSSDINKRINEYYQRTTDQQTHTSAQMIFELVMVRNGGWCLSDDGPVFTKDDISAAIERLYTV